MEQKIYKFLDLYVGPGVYSTHNQDRSFFNLFSDNKTPIITFRIDQSKEYIKLFRSESLCKTISSFFCISQDDAANYVKNWFGDRNNLKKVSDVMKFIPELT